MITKERLNEVYNKYPPNKFIKFIFKYFSSTTESKDLVVKTIVKNFLLGIFMALFFSVVFEFGMAKIFLIIYSIVLGSVILGSLSAHIMNNLRIKKIIKELGISKEEYNNLILMYGK